jgi:hypothetical protein
MVQSAIWDGSKLPKKRHKHTPQRRVSILANSPEPADSSLALND